MSGNSDILDLGIRLNVDGSVAIGDIQLTTEEIRQLRDALNEADDGLNDVDDSLDDVSDDMEELGGTASTLVEKLFSVQNVLASIGLGIGLYEISDSILRVTRETQNYTAQLKTMTGDMDAARYAFERLNQFAKETPFTLDQSIEGFVKLKALGLDPSERAMRSYGNTSSAMGKDMVQMVEAVADATTFEFERLKEFGIKSSQEGDKVSFTFRGVTTTIQKSAAEIQEYLMKIGETNFGTAMADQMATIDGQVSNFIGAMDDMWRKISEGTNVAEAVQSVLATVSDTVVFLTDNLHLMGGAAAFAAGILLTRMVGALATVNGAAITLTGTVAALGVAFKFMGGWPGLILGAISALTIFIPQLVTADEKTQNLTQSTKALKEEVKETATVLKSAYVDAVVSDINNASIATKLLTENQKLLKQQYQAAVDAGNKAAATAIAGMIDTVQAQIDAQKEVLDNANAVKTAIDETTVRPEIQAIVETRRDELELIGLKGQALEAQQEINKQTAALEKKTGDAAARLTAAEELAIRNIIAAKYARLEAVEAEEKAQKKWAESVEYGREMLEELEAVRKKSIEESQQKWLEQQEAANRIVMEGTPGLYEYSEKIQQYIELLRAGHLTQDEFNAAVLRAKGVFDDAGEASKKASKTVKAEMTPMAQAVKNAFDRMDQAGADMWSGWISGAKNSTESIKDYLNSWLAETAHMLTTRPLLLNLQAGIVGSLTGTSTGVAASGTTSGTVTGTVSNAVVQGVIGESVKTAIGSALSPASITAAANSIGISGTYAGLGAGYTSYGSLMGVNGAITGTGTLGAIGAALPWIGGALALAAIFGLFDSDSDETPDLNIYRASAGAKTQNVIDWYGQYGIKLRPDRQKEFFEEYDARSWAPGTFYSLSTRTAHDAFENEDEAKEFAKRINDKFLAIDAMIVAAVGKTGVEKILADIGDIHNDKIQDLEEPDEFEGGLDAALTSIFTDVLGRAAELVDSDFSFFKELEGDIANVVAVTISYVEATGDLKQLYADLKDLYKNDADLIAETMVELTTVNAIFDKLGHSTYEFNLASVEAVNHLLDLSGGLDAFRAKTQYFYDNYYTGEEKLQYVARINRERVDEFNETMGLIGDVAIYSKAELKSWMAVQDQNTEAGREAYNAGLDVAQSLNDMEAAEIALNEAEIKRIATVNSLIDTLNGVSEAEQHIEVIALLTKKYGLAVDITATELAEHIGSLSDPTDEAINDFNVLGNSIAYLADVATKTEKEILGLINSLWGDTAQIESLQAQLEAQEALDDAARAAYDAEMERYEASVAANQTIVDTLESLSISDLAPNNPLGQLNTARDIFETAIQRGDAERASSALRDYLTLGQQYWASGVEYDVLHDDAVAKLQSLLVDLGAPPSEPANTDTSSIESQIAALQEQQAIEKRQADVEALIDGFNTLALARDESVLDLLTEMGVTPQKIADELEIDFVTLAGKFNTDIVALSAHMIAAGSTLDEIFEHDQQYGVDTLAALAQVAIDNELSSVALAETLGVDIDGLLTELIGHGYTLSDILSYDQSLGADTLTALAQIAVDNGLSTSDMADNLGVKLTDLLGAMTSQGYTLTDILNYDQSLGTDTLNTLADIAVKSGLTSGDMASLLGVTQNDLLSNLVSQGYSLADIKAYDAAISGNTGNLTSIKTGTDHLGSIRSYNSRIATGADYLEHIQNGTAALPSVANNTGNLTGIKANTGDLGGIKTNTAGISGVKTGTDHLSSIQSSALSLAFMQNSLATLTTYALSHADNNADNMYRTRMNTRQMNLNTGIPAYETGSAFIMGDQVAQLHHSEMVIDPVTSRYLRNYGIKIDFPKEKKAPKWSDIARAPFVESKPIVVERNSKGDDVDLEKVEALLQKILKANQNGNEINRTGFKETAAQQKRQADAQQEQAEKERMG